MISRRREIVKEILLTLAYPALLSLTMASWAPFTSEPGWMSDAMFWTLLILGGASLIGTFVLAALDWDMYHDFHPVVNFLLIFVRIGGIIFLFWPLFWLWFGFFDIVYLMFSWI